MLALGRAWLKTYRISVGWHKVDIAALRVVTIDYSTSVPGTGTLCKNVPGGNPC